MSICDECGGDHTAGSLPLKDWERKALTNAVHEMIDMRKKRAKSLRLPPKRRSRQPKFKDPRSHR